MLIKIALALSILAGSGAAFADSNTSLQLVEAAFKCPTKITQDQGKLLKTEFDFQGDVKRFFLQITVTVREAATTGGDYEENYDTYVSFLTLLSFQSEGPQLVASCKKPACLSHSSASGGCDSVGTCGNISASSIKKEYVDTLRVNLCDAGAAQDASDGLNDIAQNANR